jgi:hypothetical protein
VDEFQNFSTDSFATILSEARKYHLNLIVANQFTTQLTDEIREAVFGNVGTIVAFRVGDHDVDSLAKYFSPTFDGADLLRIPNHNTVVRTLIGGVPTNPFSMSTIPPLGSPNYQLAEALKQLSAAKYGRPKAKVEAEIFKRLATAEPEKPVAAPNRFGSPSSPGAAGPAGGRRGAAPFAGNNPYPAPFGQQPMAPAPTPVPTPMPQPPVSATQPLPAVSPKPDEPKGRNISSDNMERKEVNTIAQKLKHELKSPHHLRRNKDVPTEGQEPKEHSSEVSLRPAKTYAPSNDLLPDPLAARPLEVKAPTSPEPSTVAGESAITEKRLPKPDAGEISLQQPHRAEDTIFIDQDGNLRGNDNA